MLWSHTAEVSKCFNKSAKLPLSVLHFYISLLIITVAQWGYFFNKKGWIDLNDLHDELHDSIFFLRA